MFARKPQQARAGHIPHVRETADAYNAEHKLPKIRRRSEPLPLSLDFSRRTAQEYERLPSGAPKDRASKRSYDAFAAETQRQYDWALAHGYTFEPSEADPYSAPGSTKMAQMRDDVRERKHLTAYASQLTHPYLSDEDNLRFRFVHDLFGHAQEGNSIGPRGEYNAAHSHAQMFSRRARPAMLAETHGQNSVVNFSTTPSEAHGGRSIAEVNAEAPGTIYAEQKGTILPRHLVREFDRLTRGGSGFDRLIGRKR